MTDADDPRTIARALVGIRWRATGDDEWPWPWPWPWVWGGPGLCVDASNRTVRCLVTPYTG